MTNLGVMEGRQEHAEVASQTADTVLARPSLDDDTAANLLYQRALAKRFQEDTDGAVADFTAALEKLPTHMGAAAERANTLQVAGRPGEARGAFDQLVQAFPENPAGLQQPGHVPAGRGRPRRRRRGLHPGPRPGPELLLRPDEPRQGRAGPRGHHGGDRRLRPQPEGQRGAGRGLRVPRQRPAAGRRPERGDRRPDRGRPQGPDQPDRPQRPRVRPLLRRAVRPGPGAVRRRVAAGPGLPPPAPLAAGMPAGAEPRPGDRPGHHAGPGTTAATASTGSCGCCSSNSAG